MGHKARFRPHERLSGWPSSAATKTQPEHAPVLSAAARARRGAPLTDEERRAKEEGAPPNLQLAARQ